MFLFIFLFTSFSFAQEDEDDLSLKLLTTQKELLSCKNYIEQLEAELSGVMDLTVSSKIEKDLTNERMKNKNLSLVIMKLTKENQQIKNRLSEINRYYECTKNALESAKIRIHELEEDEKIASALSELDLSENNKKNKKPFLAFLRKKFK